jgi:chemotaxis-related protein WspB
MSHALAGPAGHVPARSKLFLVFRIGQERFALDALEIAEILPRLALKPIARTPAWVAGIFAHRGQMVPVIDLASLAFNVPAAARTSTRLVLVHYRPSEQPGRLLGLILEQANDTLRCAESEFLGYGLSNRQAPYLGPVREDAQGLLQWLKVDDLLDPSVREVLYADAMDAEGGRR